MPTAIYCADDEVNIFVDVGSCYVGIGDALVVDVGIEGKTTDYAHLGVDMGIDVVHFGLVKGIDVTHLGVALLFL